MSPRRAAILRAADGTASTDLHEHLVAMTEGLLDEAGIGDLTTRRIAHHAGVSDGVLYNHFDDKDELVLAALLRRYERLLGQYEANAPTAGQGSVADVLQRHAALLADLHADALHLAAGLLADAGLLGHFWAAIHHAPLGLDRLQAPLRRSLAAEIDGGRLRPDLDVEATIRLVFGVAAIAGLTRRVNPGLARQRVDDDLAASIDTLLPGLGVPVRGGART